MDIWHHKARVQAQMKRLTLKATASAVLTLNAEAVMADNCPTEIYGNALASVICDFNGVPPSGNIVTVENGGTVGGIPNQWGQTRLIYQHYIGTINRV